MAVKWSTPGIGFSEIDNSIQANSTTADGVGAIVLRSNQGYVNQRVLSTSRKRFHEQFGDQETSTDYGHFAADQYLAASPQLYAVRATMGDEGYAFVQFPYTDAAAKDCRVANLQQTFEYVDNDGVTQIKLLSPLSGNISYTSIANEEWSTFETSPVTQEALNTAFCLVSKGCAATFKDLYNDTAPATHIMRNSTAYNAANYTNTSGMYYDVLAADEHQKVFANHTLVGSTDAAKVKIFTSQDAAANANVANKVLAIYIKKVDDASAYNVSIPSTLTLTDEEINFTAKFKSTPTDNVAFTAFMTATSNVTESAACLKITPYEWDSNMTDTYYVPCSALSANTIVSGIQYREITGALYNQSLCTVSSVNTTADMYVGDMLYTELIDASDKEFYGEVAKAGFSACDTSAISNDKLKAIAYNNYGKDVEEINTSAYKVVMMLNATTNTIESKICFASNPKDKDENEDGVSTDGVFVSKWIFNSYWDKDAGVNGKRVSNAAYLSFKPKSVIEPWQYDETTNDVAKLAAYPSSEVFTDPSGKYKDGYTQTILTMDEPGNGDVERYESKQNNQLIISCVGPGEYGNNIGVSIITPEVAGNAALENQPAAFTWKNQFDDEDLVEKDWLEHPSYKDNPNNLTWKKVYKINVYVKTKTQQASVWGSGLDALLRTPVESFLVSNDPSVKDGNGNSMYAPYVINGQSKYIYVSLSSVIESRTAWGTYAMPKQTYSIYQLKGGINSKLDNIKEKTAALELYRDRQKCMFDILFNVDAIETFQSRQKYAAHQNRIAEIVAERGLDIGFIQVTSKAARTGYKALSEGKLFTFSNGSYVSCQAGYDRYYDSYTSNWVYLPKSVALAVAHGRCWANGYPWLAPAGINRGTIDYSSGQLLKLSDQEIGQLYDANINCSRTCAGYGEVIWCQKTALKKTSALNRINVRGLINYIEKRLESMLIPYLYQNNTSATRSSIRSTVDSFLSTIMAAEGIIAKSVVVKPDPDDAHLVYVNIQVIPAESIEFIQVTTTINRQNASISSSEG